MGKRRTDDEILDQLEDIFLSQGFRNVTIEGLAASLSCSRRKLYDLASSKEALFLLVIDRFFRRLRTRGREAAARHKDLDSRIQAYLDAGVGGASRLSDVFQADISELERGRVIYDRHQSIRINGLKEMIQEAVDRGELRNVHSQLAAEMMILTVRRIREPEFQSSANMGYAEALSELSEILRHGIVPRS